MAEASTETPPLARAEPVWPGWAIATAICIRFYSRLPVPALPGETDPHAPPISAPCHAPCPSRR